LEREVVIDDTSSAFVLALGKEMAMLSSTEDASSYGLAKKVRLVMVLTIPPVRHSAQVHISEWGLHGEQMKEEAKLAVKLLLVVLVRDEKGVEVEMVAAPINTAIQSDRVLSTL